MEPDAETFSVMMRQRGLARDMSFVALSGDRVVAVWLVSVDGDQSYLMASGTDPAFRGQGIARRLAECAMDRLRENHVRRFQTEVMDGNAPASALYRSLGMEVERNLDCFDLPRLRGTGPGHSGAANVPWAEIKGEVAACRDWSPTWQNNDAAVSRITDQLFCLALRDAKGLAAYAVFFRHTVSIAQIAVRRDRRRAGLGRGLIEQVSSAAEGRAVRLVNADARDPGFAAFMTAIGAEPMTGQRELVCWL